MTDHGTSTLMKESSASRKLVAEAPLLRDSATTIPATSVVSPWRGLRLALATLLAITLIKLVWDAQLGGAPSYLLYFSVILVGAWYGGFRIGLSMTVLSALVGAYLFVPPGRTERFGLF